MSGLDFARDGADWPLRETSRFVEAGGYNWHMQSAGEGPQALLLHGAAASTHSWRGLAPLLTPRMAWTAVDLPGHGFTKANARPDLSLPGMASAVASLGLSPRIVIGHSAGAAILARMIAEGMIAPDLFVAINGAFLPFGGRAAALFPAAAKFLFANPLAARLFAMSANRESVANMLAGMGTRLDNKGLDLYVRLMRDPAHCAAALGMMARWDLSRMSEDLAQTRCRTLLIVGERDLGVKPEQAVQIAKLMPNAQVVRLASLGHLAHEEKPDMAAAAITAAMAANFRISG